MIKPQKKTIQIKTILHAGYKTHAENVTPDARQATFLAHAAGPWIAAQPQYQGKPTPFMSLDPSLKGTILTHEGIVSLSKSIRETMDPKFNADDNFHKRLMTRFDPIYIISENKKFLNTGYTITQVWVSPVCAKGMHGVFVLDVSPDIPEDVSDAELIRLSLPALTQEMEILHPESQLRPSDEAIYNLWPVLATTPQWMLEPDTSIHDFTEKLMTFVSDEMESTACNVNSNSPYVPPCDLVPRFLSLISVPESTDAD